MLTERSIINFLIWITGLVIGPYLACSILWGNMTPVVVVVAGVVIFFMFAIAKDTLCLAPIVCMSMSGKIMLIPGKPDWIEFGAAAAILYYLVTYAALRRSKMLTGPLFLFIPIVIVAGIVFYHDPQVSLRFEGGGREGGRGVVDMMVAALSYVCCVSMNTPSARFFSWTPIFCIVGAIVTSFSFIVTTYLPSTAPFFYIFTDNLNMGAYMEDLTGNGGDMVRYGAQAGIGSSVAVFLLCYFPIQTWWRPSRCWVPLVFLACTWFVMTGGYRGAFAGYLVTVGLATWCRSTWRTLLLVPPLCAALAVVVGLQNSHLVHLPPTAQRTLAFLPGDWDSEPIESAKASNDFRERIRTVYLKDDAGKSPLLGNGLTYDSDEFVLYHFMSQYHETSDSYYITKLFLTGKMFHTGWISVYDATGLIGSATFAFLAFSLIWSTGKMVFGKDADRKSSLFPLKIWLFCNLTASVITFLTVFGDFKAEFINFCIVAIVWTHIHRLEKYGYHPPVLGHIMPFDPNRTKLPVPA